MDRAYSLLAAKEFAEEKNQEGREVVTVKGIASTPQTDRHGDVIDPMGAKFSTPMPLLWQHNHEAPVGKMTLAKSQKNGIPFEAEIPVVKEAGRLQDRVNEAIHSLRYELVNAVSIGFTMEADGFEIMEDGGLRINEWEWLELSLVTIPANSQAVISAVKRLDDKSLAAIGRNSDSASRIAEIRKRAGGTARRKPIMLT